MYHMSYRFEEVGMARDKIGVLEAEVLRAVMARSGDAYGLSVIQFMQLDTGRSVSVGAVYTVLERLERKGFLESRWGEVTPERGGRRKRLYTVNAAGQMALDGSAAGASCQNKPAEWRGARPAEA
jgi:PadR family transcriptional regulator, regulatory protein PadR